MLWIAGTPGLIHRRAATGLCEVIHGYNLPLGVTGNFDLPSSFPSRSRPAICSCCSPTASRRRADPVGDFFGEGSHCCRMRPGSNGALGPGRTGAGHPPRRALTSFIRESETPTNPWTCVAMKVGGAESPDFAVRNVGHAAISGSCTWPARFVRRVLPCTSPQPRIDDEEERRSSSSSWPSPRPAATS